MRSDESVDSGRSRLSKGIGGLDGNGRAVVAGAAGHPKCGVLDPSITGGPRCDPVHSRRRRCVKRGGSARLVHRPRCMFHVKHWSCWNFRLQENQRQNPRLDRDARPSLSAISPDLARSFSDLRCPLRRAGIDFGAGGFPAYRRLCFIAARWTLCSVRRLEGGISSTARPNASARGSGRSSGSAEQAAPRRYQRIALRATSIDSRPRPSLPQERRSDPSCWPQRDKGTGSAAAFVAVGASTGSRRASSPMPRRRSSSRRGARQSEAAMIRDSGGQSERRCRQSIRHRAINLRHRARRDRLAGPAHRSRPAGQCLDRSRDLVVAPRPVELRIS